MTDLIASRPFQYGDRFLSADERFSVEKDEVVHLVSIAAVARKLTADERAAPDPDAT